MIRTLIIEDEFPAARRLELLLTELNPEINILDKLDSVKGAVKWFQNNPAPDLVMLDIQLADGLSFDIFKSINVDSFIIFTTAYDEYAIKAFQLNSLDYLLKPIDKVKLSQSLEKYHHFKQSTPLENIEALLQTMVHKESNYKKRFAINMGSKIKSIETSDVSYFQSVEKSTFLITTEGKSYPVDFSLDKLESLVNPESFFRINRQAIVNYPAIEKIAVLSKSRIQLKMKATNEELLVSTAKTHAFRQWIDK